MIELEKKHKNHEQKTSLPSAADEKTSSGRRRPSRQRRHRLSSSEQQSLDQLTTLSAAESDD